MATEYNQIDTGFFEEGVDVGKKYVTKSYLMDVYPYLIPDIISTPGLFVCGYNNYGQLGINDITHMSYPVQTVANSTNWRSVSCGQYHMSAIKTDGTLWSWGRNNNGQLGTNNITDRSSPVQTVSGGTNWKSVAAGYLHTSAIKTDGTLWSWGDNQVGQLGTNNITHRSSPVQTVSGGTNWKSVAAGSYHNATIKTDGTLWVWGQNFYGQLGTNDRNYKSSPTQITPSGWKSASAGYFHTSVIKTDGTLWVWGQNSYGQLGIDDITNRSSPVQTIAGGTNWKSVAAGNYHTSAIKTDGTLWVWGQNSYGQLGTNDITDRSSPVQTVSGGTNWKSASAGYFHTSAIKTDGTLWSWGDNQVGQLGTNDITDRSSPVQTVSGGTNWKSVEVGQYTFAAIAELGNDF